MKKILWMSQHEPLPSQISALKRIFGEVEVVKDPKPFSSAEDIVGRFRSGGYDDIVVVGCPLRDRKARGTWRQAFVGPNATGSTG